MNAAGTTLPFSPLFPIVVISHECYMTLQWLAIVVPLPSRTVLGKILSGANVKSATFKTMKLRLRSGPSRSAGQSACNPTCDCGVSFQQPRESALLLVVLDLAVGSVRLKTAAGTFALLASCENATVSPASRRWRSAKPEPDSSAGCTNPCGSPKCHRARGALRISNIQFEAN